MNVLMLMMVAIAGGGVSVQIAANNRLREAVQSPALGITLAFAVGTVGMALLTLSGVLGRGHLAGAASAPWWAWIGGLLSAFAVIITLLSAQKDGEEATVATFIFGQLIVAALLDHFGWLGVKQSPLNAWKIGGALVVFVGVLIMQKK
ncbi:hypothetical protein CCAX7_16240 [Capsulimonas corticalis]|uniref:Uncharacterized protein n=1 Tax=Capsulimonas corticalis TaxID=2219043 RepID=A0A402CZ39_9BACT|nr:DMT family transporter [Capsulimonas corticalis]BDI29573.1 hypothetical protein CCAX7_16240 [Capsulimonas corticalis]